VLAEGLGAQGFDSILRDAPQPLAQSAEWQQFGRATIKWSCFGYLTEQLFSAIVSLIATAMFKDYPNKGISQEQ